MRRTGWQRTALIVLAVLIAAAMIIGLLLPAFGG